MQANSLIVTGTSRFLNPINGKIDWTNINNGITYDNSTKTITLSTSGASNIISPGEINMTTSSANQLKLSHDGIEMKASGVGITYSRTDAVGTGMTWDGTNTSLKTAVTNKLDKSGGTITGILIAKKGVYSHGCGSSGGTNGYFKFATITVNAAYVNRPIVFSVVRRGSKETVGTVLFSNVSSLTPNMNLYYNGDFALFYVKTGNSTWDLYVEKGEAYGNVYFNIINPGQLVSGGITWDWTDTTVASLPEGYVTATVETRTLNATTARQLINTTVRPTSADAASAYYDGGLRHFLASNRMETNKPMSDGSIIDMQWDTSVGFNKQLFVGHQGTTKTRMQVRSQNQGTWGSWLPIGVFTQTAPTSGQLVVTDGTDGGIKASGTIMGNLVIGNNSEYPKSYIDITQTSPNPNVYICYQGSSSEIYGTRVSKNGVSVNHNSSSLELRSDDIVFSSAGNVSTWDGTNTSLKTALANKMTNQVQSAQVAISCLSQNILMYKCGRIVYFSLVADFNASLPSKVTTNVGSITASDWRPIAIADSGLAGHNNQISMSIKTDGTITMYNYTTAAVSTGWFRWTGCYITAS